VKSAKLRLISEPMARKFSFLIIALKVFEESRETFFKKLLLWGAGQSPAIALLHLLRAFGCSEVDWPPTISVRGKFN
jgi:hypothetical protein